MKFVINTLEEVGEAFRSEYEARNGKFYLKTEGDFQPLVDANTKLAEFRDNNRALNTKVTELEGAVRKFDGIDPTEVVTLRTKVADFERNGLKPDTNVTKMIQDAVAAAVGPLQTKLTEREASEKVAQEALARTAVENSLRDAGIKAGVDERALPDYIRRGMEVFKNVDGKIVARNGDAPIFSKKNVTEDLSMEEWAGNLQKDAPFLFKASRGGGAPQGVAGSGFQGERKVISADPMEFGRNLESIAKGETIVQQ